VLSTQWAFDPQLRRCVQLVWNGPRGDDDLVGGGVKLKHAHPCPLCGRAIPCIELDCVKAEATDVILPCESCAKKRAMCEAKPYDPHVDSVTLEAFDVAGSKGVLFR
jgi:hypothetical protein